MLIDQAGGMASTLLALLETRLELMAVELREEQQRFIALSVMSAVAVGLALLALLAATAGAVLLLAPEHRSLGWLGFAGFYAVGSLLLWGLVRWRIQRRPPPFGQTRRELKEDRRWL